VRVSVIARGGEDQAKQAQALRRLIPCLHSVGYVDRLHAKMYLSEHEAIITSMNLVESSALNSVEIAVHIEQAYAAKEYRQAKRICDDLLKTAAAGRATRSGGGEAYVRSAPAAVSTARRRRKHGFCIRCSESIDFDAEKPLCEDCFKVWARYKNPEYEENHCHACGAEAATSLQDPLCEDCE
jgi:hypothetical protein